MKKIFVISAILALTFSANATVLIFNNADGSLVGGYGAIPQGYGDYVSAAIQNGFSYGAGSHGWTPDVNVSYPVRYDPIWHSENPYLETHFGWDNGYSDLVNVVYPWIKQGVDAGSWVWDDIEITFKPSNGTAVAINGFDMGSYNGTYELNWDVRNSVGQILTSGTVTATTGTHTHVAVDANIAVSSTKLVLTVYTSAALSSAPNIAIDNIEFSQVGTAPPECGDENHPIVTSDLNKDCMVNFEDFALFALDWLICNNPDPPCNYVP